MTIKRLIATRRTLEGIKKIIDIFLAYYILTEDSIVLMTEAGEGMVTEDAP
jgi:hypothetical protein